ncbi:FMN-dependent alpha-hydroxy acid dehydrogenase [Wallemia mellicola CBS 633.66]|uniref:Oxidase FUB9 n=1 Tax=Wallemia mellicola (strain ATCC MYA-4683 / CBS 633.66) TaxID=671144 RepID=I4YFS0_WALMC|nr:FMN-dependent alpha-hydroxy acid dehydrogenase [Wallemia mellicola CBS 633.66]TIB84373.1 FMN-dependent alpha-hydroxy acid dehydrogenase [Wallemia mellicola]EIM22812.1 FMN-dependent alpha-hydroxy acid dehydrogenase [Wallemia mellicola CBS 633.66]TIB94132.1 FMN-dependent alpha-hydroxy acid dehydrogenase [Wallemia mellicola]TIC06651.1 FMN-dependent alpha-hydroxy acid dehydrogenase [Wallemia mellicola]TIC48006.1 FMN-dependent alpha-hydroxy acid dehydrogenase [Wallemia mellicola]|eukprot:XP_006956865.1 FMN-dependent alpha-hydroxy acid dehydrogenase [Wallemia mellicola CBS 633.66]
MNRPTKCNPSITCISDLEKASYCKLNKTVAEYYNEGSMDLITLRDNTAVYDRYKLRPRVLRNLTNLDTSTMCLGSRVSFPLGISPTAMQGLAHPGRELATSRAASKMGVNMCLSTYTNTSSEDVIAQSNGGNSYAQQLSIMKDNSINMEIIKGAEKAGYKAIFLTIDCPYLGRRLNEYRNQFKLPEHLTLPNLPVEDGNMVTRDERLEYDDQLDWEGIARFKNSTHCEIWLKGILTAEDAMLAVEAGVDGIIVSNHGARQLDGSCSTLDALPEVVGAVGGRIPVHLDGGIRRGTDIFKAIALGAQHVWIGRPVLWGLAYNGQEGVELALQLLYDEFRLCQALCGCLTINDITSKHLARLHADGRYRPIV